VRESLSYKRYNTDFRYYLIMLRCTILFTLALPLLLAQAPKQRVSRAADLPVFTYKIEGAVIEIIKSTANKTPDGRRNLINPAAAVAMAHRR